MTDKTNNAVGVDLTVKTSSNAVNRAIKTVKTVSGKYNQAVQDAIVLIIRHANDYGDCTGAARLLDAMPRSNRRQLVVDHFAQYSPINVTKKNDKFSATLRKPYYDKAETKPDNNYRPFDIDGVKSNNWWERPEAERLADVVSYDTLHKSIMAMLDSKLKKADDCENDNDKQLAKDFIKSIRSAASAFSVKLNSENAMKGTEWDDEAREETVKAAA
jgi:hypothetical protein